MNPIYMHHDLEDIPIVSLPDHYQFHVFSAATDAEEWAHIVTKAGEFASEEEAWKRFKEEFSPDINEVRKRVIFITTCHGKKVGTATAWFGTWQEQVLGRLHWVAILPEYQGEGLGCPLITKTMQLLQKHHDEAYLKTQETSEAAIHLYKKLGWDPMTYAHEEENT